MQSVGRFLWQPFVHRLRYAWATLSIWGRLILLLYAALSLYDLAQGQGLVPGGWPHLSEVFGEISWQWWVIVGLAIIILGLVEGGYRRLGAFQGEKHTPHNRDALVTAIHEFGKAASDLLLRYRIVASTRMAVAEARAHGAKIVDHGSAKADVYKATHDRLELEERIAGAAFNRRLRLYRSMVTLEVDKWKYSDDPITEEGYDKSRKAIAEATEEILRRVDDGGLYSATSA